MFTSLLRTAHAPRLGPLQSSFPLPQIHLLIVESGPSSLSFLLTLHIRNRRRSDRCPESLLCRNFEPILEPSKPIFPITSRHDGLLELLEARVINGV